jgi:hypothetical protein
VFSGLLDLEIMDVQAVHLQLLDLEVADDGPTDGQPADRQGTDGARPKGRGCHRDRSKAPLGAGLLLGHRRRS